MLKSRLVGTSLILSVFVSLAGCGLPSQNTPPGTSAPSPVSQASQSDPHGPTPLPTPLSTPTGDDLTVAASTFVDLLVKEDYESAAKSFDPTMKAVLPPAKLKETWRGLLAQTGTFKRQVGTRTDRVTDKGQQYDIVFVTCEFEKGLIDTRVVFNSSKQIAGLFFAPADRSSEYKTPSYVKAETFSEKEVTVGSGEWALPGTLSLPKGSGPFAAVVLVQGSGPNDRDETIGPNKPFRDLAGGIASQGVAVLRYEKRTKQHAAKLAPLVDRLTVKEETTDDALAAVALLRKTEGIRSDKIFVLGHSLGGMLIPRLATQDPGIAGLIVMAGNTRPMEDLILEQVTYLASLKSPLTDEDNAQIEEIKKAVARVKDPGLSPSTPTKDLPLGIGATYWLNLRGYEPATVAQSLKQPMLILQGERDYQVTTTDFQGWQKALSNRQNVEFKLYPNLNHLFFDGSGKSTPYEYDKPGHVVEGVVSDIAAWIRRQ